MMSSLMQDVWYAVRQLRRSPGFTVTVVVVLALGIGANAAMFTVLEGTLLRRLPYGSAGRLVSLSVRNDKEDVVWNNLLDVEQWRQRSRTIEEIGYYNTSPVYLNGGIGEQELNETNASANLLHVLGVEPALGRGFTAEEQQPGKGDVVLLSDAVWRAQFHAAADVLGKVVTINQLPVTVIGVMPAGFVFPANTAEAQVWRPAELTATSKTRDYDAAFYNVIAKRRSGASIAGMNEELSGIQRQLVPLYAVRMAGALAPSRVRAVNYRESLVEEQETALLALMGAVSIVWLIACANVANLMLARSTVRRREMAVRSALGASRSRLVQQLMVESLLLSFSGAALGMVLARGTLLAFRHALATELSPTLSLQPDGRVLAALLGLSVLSALLFGVGPALLAAQMPLDQSLRQDGAQAGTARRQQRVQRSLVVMEIGLSLALLVACGLLLRTVFALRHVPLGFRTDHVYVVQPKLPGYKYRVLDANETVYKPLLDRIQRMHGVEAAAITTVAPLEKGFGREITIWLTATTGGEKLERKLIAQMKSSGPELQKVMGLHMAEGRFFTSQDTPNSQPVAVVNRAFAKLYEEGGGVSVTHFSLAAAKDRRFQIVGVVDDFRQKAVGEEAVPEIDFNAAQLRPTDNFYQSTLKAHAELVIRASADERSLLPDLLRAMHEVNPELRAGSVETMEKIVADSMGDQILAAHLLESLGALALLVSLAGLYSLLAYLVTLRTRELGLRMALGAQRAQILALVMGQAGWMIAGGVVLGVGMSLATTQLLKHFLFGVKARDMGTIIGATVLIMIVSAAAAYLPARRAARIEPMDALRTE